VTSARANRRLGVMIASFAAGMVAVAYASVPLYDLFCRVTGYAGTTGRAAEAPSVAGDRVIQVTFNADIGRGLPWAFRAPAPIAARIGEEHVVRYVARNDSAEPITGTATFNVTPHKAGVYFQKIACFCFNEQRLEPGQSVEMAVSFFIDPDIVKDRNLRDVGTITLSYTFFRALAPANDARAALSSTVLNTASR
jgi:cytochrome c oxidase assembly protein subunit 11